LFDGIIVIKSGGKGKMGEEVFWGERISPQKFQSPQYLLGIVGTSLSKKAKGLF
jgi:hypothetical protein